MVNPKQCPCNSKQPYALCCGRYHKGKIHASTAEALMRSRFSAYVLKHIQYIYRTWDVDTRPPLNVLREDNSQVFTSLEIISTKTEDNTATVEFIANYKINDSDDIQQHKENSYFVKRQGRWLYVNELSQIKQS